MPCIPAKVLDSIAENPFLDIFLFTANPRRLWKTSHLIRVFQGTLRGIGQVAFVNSAVTGIAILIGCAIYRPLAAALGFISTLLCTLFGYIILGERNASINGLHGYNAFLFGMGVGYFDNLLDADRAGGFHFAYLLVPVVLGSSGCFLIHLALSKSLSTPAFTFAYNITLSCWLAYAVSLGPSSTFVPSFSAHPPASDPIQYAQINFGWFMECTLAGIGQVFFSPELASSIIILAGLTVGSPIAGILALFGSAVGNAIAILSHASTSAAEAGVYGLSAVLCAIGLGGFYFVFSKWSVMLAFVGSVFCVPTTAVFAGLLVRPMGPSMTFPFCAVATFFYLGAKHLPRPVAVPTDSLDSPERHLCLSERDEKQVHANS